MARRAVPPPAWPVLRFFFGIGILVVAVWVLSSHRDDFSGFSQVFRSLKLVVAPTGPPPRVRLLRLLRRFAI